MVLDQQGGGLRLRGELYEISAETLRHLDALESIGKPGNLRRMVDVESTEPGIPSRAILYMKSPELASPLHSGYLDDYRRFIPPGERQAT